MKYELELTIRMTVEAPELSNPQFFFEEHKCLDDLICQLKEEVDQATQDKTCTCHRGSIRLIT